ncbi:MAG: ABC transporter substrate-binding protein [Paracoccus sp. (in: a-proteobacteria)]
MVRSFAALMLLLAGAAHAGTTGINMPPPPPSRVVSINLCTDQLAMLIADPKQLRSVSYIAADPRVSLMAEKARSIDLNHGQAEEIFLMQPDLVLANNYSDPAILDMLARLGIRTETLPPAGSIANIRENITHIGKILGQTERAATILANFDADLAAIPKGRNGQLATTYAANGFANGSNTLSADVMRHAGLMLLADQLGLASSGQVALEQLVITEPELVITGSREITPSRAEALLDHPAFSALQADRLAIPDRDWICGLPAITDTVARLMQ